MRRYGILAGLIAVGLAGCHDTHTGTNAKPESGGSAANAAMLDPLVMKQKPDKALSVRDVMSRKEGETVVVSGRTPPEKVKPFNAALAAFLLMAPEDLEQKDIAEEFECDDAETCPSCRKVLDQHAVRVEIVDAAGAVIPATLEGYRGLKPGSLITVEGEIKRDGKDQKLIRIVAKRFYPG